MALTRVWRSSALLLALALPACLRNNDGVDTSPEAAVRREMERSEVLGLEVVNRSTYSIDLYVQQGVSQFRIGEARPLTTTRQVVPDDLVVTGAVTILGIASPGGLRVSSSRLNVQRGQTIVFEISANLRDSRAYLR